MNMRKNYVAWTFVYNSIKIQNSICIDFYLKINMGTMNRRQLLKLTMNLIKFQEIGHSAIHQQQ